MPDAPVRVRIAPAPTGSLHVGNARTALYNYLFARHHGGAFILRIEDTDRVRSTDEAIQVVYESLHWLGIQWDEGPDVGGEFGPYRQSEKLTRYAEVTEVLRTGGHAYPCYCTPEELDERRKAAMAQGRSPGYDGRCRRLTEAERAELDAEGRPHAMRFAMPGEDLTVTDLIRGEAHFPAVDLQDFVIVRSDGSPTYMLAAAVDDADMAMTHVIRGEDLLPSTPRQLAIFRALGAEPPAYAHLPLIVGSDRQPLSKRHGSVAVETFRQDGFLPDALVNYLALLGWSYDEETTFFTRDELIERFDLSRVSHNPAAFDVEKLTWLNGHYLREAPDEALAAMFVDRLREAGVEADPEVVLAAVPVVKTRIKTLADVPGMLRFLFEDVEPDQKAAAFLGPERSEYLTEVVSRLEALEGWDHEAIKGTLDALREERGLSSKQGLHPVRAAITGALISPPLYESMELLGRDRSLERLRRAAGV
ncbi:MAG: glutamate--tRNA ligase [Actinomycetota bacterium]